MSALGVGSWGVPYAAKPKGGMAGAELILPDMDDAEVTLVPAQ